MSDVMKFIVNTDAAHDDPDGHLMELDSWSEDAARQLAREEGVELTDDHWNVLRFLRDQYREHGSQISARKLGDLLDERFSAKGGRKYLYQLFPNGPVSQGSRLAGLPMPDASVDRSFGSMR